MKETALIIVSWILDYFGVPERAFHEHLTIVIFFFFATVYLPHFFPDLHLSTNLNVIEEQCFDSALASRNWNQTRASEFVAIHMKRNTMEAILTI